MKKSEKLKKLYNALSGGDMLSPDFSVFDEEIAKLKEQLREKLVVRTLGEVNGEIAKLKKQVNIDPLISSVEGLRTDFYQAADGLLSSFEERRKELEKTSGILEKNSLKRDELLSQEIEKLQQSFQGLIEEKTKALETIKNQFSETLRDIQGNFENFAKETGISVKELKKLKLEDKNFFTEELNLLRKDFEKSRTDLISRFSNTGGGNANRQIKIDGTVMSNRYTDINFVAGSNVSISAADDNTNKRVNITLTATGTIDGSGAANQVAYWSDANTLTGNNNLYWDATNNRLGLGTTAPLGTLHTKGSSVFNYAEATGTFGTASFGLIGNIANATAAFSLSNSGGICSSAFQMGSGISSFTFIGFGATDLIFTTNLIERFRIGGSTGAVIFNNPGSATADFTIEGDTDANLFFVDASADKIGLGTNAPIRKLHLHGAPSTVDIAITDTTTGATTSDGFQIQMRSADSATYIYNLEAYAMIFGTNNAERMRIDSAGDVGIGTTDPLYKLHVEESLAGASRIYIRNTSNSSSAFSTFTVGNDALAVAGGFFANSSTNTSYGGASSFNLINVSNAPLTLGANNAIAMTILGNGNVGINNTTPDEKLHVTGNVKFGDNTTSRIFSAYGGSGTGSDYTGVQNGTEMMSFGFNNEGTFSGTSGAANGRQIYFYDRVTSTYRGSLDGAGTWWFGTANTNYGLRIELPGGSITGVMIDASGNLGIGTGATVSAKLHAISTTEQFRLGYDANNRLSVTLDANANATFNLTAGSGTPEFTFSDPVKGPINAYGSGWNGSAKFATEDAIYDQLEAIPGGASTYVVAAAGGDYTDIQSALDAVGANGATIYIADGTYTITSTLLIKKSSTKIICGGGAIIQCNGATVTTLIKPDTTGLSRIVIDGGKWLQTNATAQGTCMDFSDSANCWVRNVRIEEFGTAFALTDTVSSTFYNSFKDSQIFNCNNGILVSGSQANMNLFENVRVRPKAGGAGIGASLIDARGTTFVHCDFEPATGTGITGISVDATSRENTFVNCWVENNATGVSIASGANRTTFIGCSITSNTSDISDSGTQTVFLNTSDTGVLVNQLGSLTGTLIANGTTTSSGAGAVGITGSIHEITTTGTGNALTLADGTEGQRLTVVYVAEGAGTDTAVLTPTNFGSGTTITFSTLGQSARLIFTNGKWYADGDPFGAVIA